MLATDVALAIKSPRDIEAFASMLVARIADAFLTLPNHQPSTTHLECEEKR